MGAYVNLQAVKGSGSDAKKEKKPPVAYTINVVSPPPKCLGVHLLPHNTQCGEMVQIGQGEEAKVRTQCAFLRPLLISPAVGQLLSLYVEVVERYTIRTGVAVD